VSGSGRPPPLGALGAGVDDQVGDGDGAGEEPRRAAQQRPQAGQQLAEVEGLGEVVVAPGVEAGDPVGHGVARGEHQHRVAPPARPQLAADAEPVALRHHHVEHGGVVGVEHAQVQRPLAVARPVDRIGLFAQPARQHLAQPRIVLRQQHPHLASPCDPGASTTDRALLAPPATRRSTPGRAPRKGESAPRRCRG